MYSSLCSWERVRNLFLIFLFLDSEVLDKHKICIPDCTIFGCPTDLVCNKANRLCEASIPCRKVRPCPPGMYGKDDTCHHIECYNNDVCMMLNRRTDICVNGQCVAGEIRCTGKACSNGMTCTNSFCSNSTETETCPLGLKMVNKKCELDIICSLFQKCPHDMSCQGLTCENIICPETRCPALLSCDMQAKKCRGVVCTVDSDCMTPDVCDKINNICVPSCTDCFGCGAPCPFGLQCNGKMCQWKKACTSYMDCRGVEQCKDSFCSQAECVEDTQCEATKPFCVFGTCTALKICTPENNQCKAFGDSFDCYEGYCYKIKSCNGTDGCKKNEYCDPLAKMCLPQYRYRGKCPVDMEVKLSEEYCIAVNCSAKKCPKSRICSKGGFCMISEDTNCTDGIKRNGQCYTKCDKDDCTDCGKDCKTGCECIDNMCMCKTECETKMDCPRQRYCDIESKKCKIPPCFLSKDCLDKKSCIMGKCVNEIIKSCDVVCSSSEDRIVTNDTCRWNRCLPPEFHTCPDIPCPSGHTCDASLKLCIADIICDNDKDCPPPLSCSNGFCKKKWVVKCPEPLELVNGEICLPHTSCTSKIDCGKLEGCIDNFCKPFCSGDKDCKEDEFCSVYKICQVKKPCSNCTVGQFCIKEVCHSTICQVHKDCPKEKPVCDRGNCKRENQLCSQFCKGKCFNGLCVVDECSSCFEGEQCEDGYCVQKNIICESVCPPGMVCKDGICKKCKPTETCGIQIECNCTDGKVCYKGECSTICNGNKDCSSGLCRSGICQPESACPCSVGQVCVNQACIGPQCVTDHCCTPPQFCYLGRCYTTIDICQTDQDCFQDEKCENRVCKKDRCNCQAGEQCENGFCYLETICYQDYDCANGLHCDLLVHKCKPIICKVQSDCRSERLTCSDETRKCIFKTGCVVDADCKDNFKCNKPLGICMPNPVCYDKDINDRLESNINCTGTPSCFETSCPANYRCINGTCEKYTECPCQAPLVCKGIGFCVLPKCLGDADCLSNERCNDGECTIIICTDNSQCSRNDKCIYGTCQPNPPSCPCSKNFYCDSNEKCKPRRRCNPMERACNYDEECQCQDNECFCVEITCKNKPEVCKTPDYCHPYSFTCKRSAVCYSNKDCSDNTCCDLQLNRCFPCCKRSSDCQENQSCLKGTCITVTSNEPKVFCNKNNVCRRIECTLHYHCRDKWFCFYGECVEKADKCKDCKYPCFKDLCLELTEPWSITTEENRTDVYVHWQKCKGQLCIPNIKCYHDYHCPQYLECGDGEYCNFKNCTSQECEPPFVCVDDVCVPKPGCHSSRDCGKNEDCFRGECRASCTKDECSGRDKHCSLLWPQRGVCTEGKDCLPSGNDCKAGYYCSFKKKCEILPPACPLGYGMFGGHCDRVTGCRSDADCLTGQICSEFKAYADRRICITGQSCRNKDCLPGKKLAIREKL